MSVQVDGEWRPYSPRIVRKFVEYRARQHLARASKGLSQFVFSYGGNAKSTVETVIRLARASSDHDIEFVSWECRPARPWEQGLLCLQSLILRQNHDSATQAIGHDKKLFNHALFDGDEQSLVHESMQPGFKAPEAVNISLDLVLLRDKRYPEACIVFVRSYHPSFSTEVFGHSEPRIGQTMDLAITLAEDLFFDRFTTRLFPRPDWRFSNRKNDAVLTEVSETEPKTPGLATKQKELLRQLFDHQSSQGKTVIPHSLPPVYLSRYQSATLVHNSNGVSLDPQDVVAIILELDRSRSLRSSRLDAAKSTRSKQAQKTAIPATVAMNAEPASSSSRPPAATPTPALPASVSTSLPSASSHVPATGSASKRPQVVTGPEYDCICECGLPGRASEYHSSTGLVPVLLEVKISRTGRHPATALKLEGQTCLTGIPISSLAEAEACMYRKSKNSQSPTTLGDLKDRVRAAYNRYTSSLDK